VGQSSIIIYNLALSVCISVLSTLVVSNNSNHLLSFIGRTDADVEEPILWPPDEKSQLIGKDADAGKD